MKKNVLLCVMAAGLAFAQSAYLEKSLEEKCAAKDLSFLVTFDKHDVNANFAKGDKYSTTLRDLDLGLRGLIGFDGKCAYQPETGEALRFPVAGNVDPHKGTLILWTAGMGYAPGDAETDGKKRGNIALAHIMVQNGERWIEFQLYEYADNVYFDWRNSEEPRGFGSVGRVAIPRKGIRKGQWHQLAATWDDRRLTFYLNGEKVSETALPAKVTKTADIKAVNNPESFIGIKSPFYEDKHEWKVAVDDVAIYSRPLTALEIRNQYVRLLKNSSAVQKVQAYSVTLNGVNIGRKDKIDRLEVEFDFAAISEKNQQALEKGELVADYTIIAPDGTKRSGQWTFLAGDTCRILSGIDQVGKYTLETAVGKEKVTESIERPDFSWVMNGLGDEDEVPAIWRDFAVSGRTVTLWNRVYQFGAGPLPMDIQGYGKPLLAERPILRIDGQEPTWTAGPTSRTNRTVTFTGEGKIGQARIRYATTVEFDGLIKFGWRISGNPTLSRMELTWRLSPENHQFLMTPTVDETREVQKAFPYPQTGGAPKLLWFVTEKKGGFAFTMENDANWVYTPGKPVFFADKATGACRVEMVNREVTLPEDTPYSALFIATPTRPLPELNRVIQYGDSRGGKKSMVNGGGNGGFKGVFTHEPHEYDFEYRNKNRLPNTASVYGAANALTTYEPCARYLRKYWEIPGAYSYNMPFERPIAPGQYVKERYFSLSACNSGVINDFYLAAQDKLYRHRLGDRIWQVYYDLCGDGLCGNTLHGCGFKDKFGRNIKTFSVLYKRDLIRRTVTLAHRYGKTLMIHAQRDFIPHMSGLADYYFPGEQYGALLRRNPFGYTDEVSDAIYRSEFNRNVLGIGVIHLPALAQADRANFKPPAYKYTEAMICMLQSHDIETSQEWAAGKPVQKVWDILARYGVADPSTECRLYHEQSEVKSSAPEVRVTYYACPQGRYVLFLANKDIRAHETEIDVNRIAGGDFLAREEYRDTAVNVKGGKFAIQVPSRSFCIVVFPPIPEYPIRDSMERAWSSWRDKNCDTKFSRNLMGGMQNSPCLKMESCATGGGCFHKAFRIKPGQIYTWRIMVRQEGGAEGNHVSLGIQGRRAGKLVGLPPVSVRKPATAEWQKLELKFTIPATGKWKECEEVLLTMGASGKHCTTFFDDFEMDLLPDKP